MLLHIVSWFVLLHLQNIALYEARQFLMMRSVFFFNRHLALAYANNHARMADMNTPSCDKNDEGFARKGGITNGAAWYSVEGGNVYTCFHFYSLVVTFKVDV